MGTPVTVGVLGCASIARRRVLPALRAEPSVELVATASRDADKAAQTAREFGCEPVTGYANLLARADIEAVYLPVPTGLHAQWAGRALRAGKHVLAEKPLTTSVAETVTLLGLARSLGLVLRENFMFVHHHQHDVVRGLLAHGAIGELRNVVAQFAIPGVPAGDIRLRPDLGGGALLDIGVYPLRTVQMFLGHRLELLGADLTDDPATGVDVSGSALLRRSDGVTAHVTFGMRHHYRATYELWGSAGSIRVDRAFAPPPDHRPVVQLADAAGMRELELAADDQYRHAVRAFVHAIRCRAGDPDTAATVALARLVDAVRARSRARA